MHVELDLSVKQRFADGNLSHPSATKPRPVQTLIQRIQTLIQRILDQIEIRSKPVSLQAYNGVIHVYRVIYFHETPPRSIIGGMRIYIPTL